jgi:hypothetical protein
LFEGLDIGFFFRRVYDATLRTFLNFSCALFVVEPDPAFLALVFHLHDWSDLLRDLRVFLFAGESATRRLAATWQENVNLSTPTQAYTMSTFRPGCRPSAIQVAQDETDRRDNTSFGRSTRERP